MTSFKIMLKILYKFNASVSKWINSGETNKNFFNNSTNRLMPRWHRDNNLSIKYMTKTNMWLYFRKITS